MCGHATEDIVLSMCLSLSCARVKLYKSEPLPILHLTDERFVVHLFSPAVKGSTYASLIFFQIFLENRISKLR